MLLKLVILVPSVFSIALCAYLLVGIGIHFRSLYRTALASESARARHDSSVSAASSAPSVEMEALPAT
jgi:hypothetical protein